VVVFPEPLIPTAAINTTIQICPRLNYRGRFNKCLDNKLTKFFFKKTRW
jgi:hypothetical protein